MWFGGNDDFGVGEASGESRGGGLEGAAFGRPTGMGFNESEGGFMPGANDFLSTQPGDPRAASSTLRRGVRLAPAKAAMVFNSYKANMGDNQITICGEEISYLKLIGLARNTDTSTENKISFDLDDGSAVIHVEWYTGGFYDEDYRATPFRGAKIAEICDNYYVSVWGDVNLLGKLEPNIKAHVVRRVESCNEIAFHDIDVAYNVLKLMEVRRASRPRSPHRMSSGGGGGGFAPSSHSENSFGFGGGGGYPTSSSGAPGGNPYQQQRQDGHSSGHKSGGNGYNSGAQHNAHHSDSVRESAGMPMPMEGSQGDVLKLKRAVNEVLTGLSGGSGSQGLHVNRILNQTQQSGYPDLSMCSLRVALNSLADDSMAHWAKDEDHWRSALC